MRGQVATRLRIELASSMDVASQVSTYVLSQRNNFPIVHGNDDAGLVLPRGQNAASKGQSLLYCASCVHIACSLCPGRWPDKADAWKMALSQEPGHPLQLEEQARSEEQTAPTHEATRA